MTTVSIDITGSLLVDGEEEEVAFDSIRLDIDNPNGEAFEELLDRLLHKECHFKRINNAKKGDDCFITINGNDRAGLYITRTDEEYFNAGYNGTMVEWVTDLVDREMYRVERLAKLM
jgi:hypothetical protein